MISLGKSYSLPIVRKVDFGAYVDAGELGEVLVPNKYLPENKAPGEQLEVFLHLDSEDRILATTRQPKACVGEFACLKAVDETRVGTFLDWGLDKDLLVPFGEQQQPMQLGRSYLVYVYLSKSDGRIIASSKIDRFLRHDAHPDYAPGEAVELIIAKVTELGYKAIINHRHWGLLYRDEVFQPLRIGQQLRGYIKQVRADGKIDLSLDGGRETRADNLQRIEEYLRQHDGFAPLHDKTDATVIAELFGISKRAFKKAIGELYKKRIISIDNSGIHLLPTKTDSDK